MPGTLHEFEKECKRMRPEFDPETEFNSNLPSKPTGSAACHTGAPILFVSVFSKSNSKLNNEIMVRKPSNYKSKVQSLATNSSKRKASKNKPIKSKVPTIKSNATGGLSGVGESAITDYFKIIIPNYKIESEFSAGA